MDHLSDYHEIYGVCEDWQSFNPRIVGILIRGLSEF